MKDKDFENLLHCKVKYDAFIPVNQTAQDFVLNHAHEDVYLEVKTPRDLKFHACYFALCGFIWDNMPTKFKETRCANKEDFYKYLKLISGQYKVSIIFKDKEVIEFESISFANMNEQKFRDYVNDQLTYLYSEILVPLKMEQFMDEINEEFSSFINQLI